MSFEFDLSSNQPEPPPVKAAPEPLSRMPIAWALLFAMFAFLIFGAIGGDKSRAKTPKEESKIEIAERTAKLQLSMSSLAKQPATVRSKAFESELDMLIDDAKTKPEAQRLRAVLRVESDAAPFGDDIKNLKKSKNPSDQAFAELVSASKLDKKTSEPLLKQIGTKKLADILLRVQVQEKLGDKGARAKAFPPESATRLLLAGMLACSSFIFGFIAWGVYANQTIAGLWRPFGHVFSGVDGGRADRLALAATLVIGSYLIGGIVAAVLYQQLKTPVLNLLPFAAIGVTIFSIFRYPLAGYRITAADMGLRKEGIGREVAWGFGTALANVPVLLLAVAISTLFSKYLPGGGHPVVDELRASKSFLDILPIFLLAAVVAPIWEEIVFRGLIFPALSKYVGVFGGALASSLMFASIHPQGAMGVTALSAIAMMLCGLTYQRKSLIGPMVFHSLNNAGMLILNLLVGPIIS